MSKSEEDTIAAEYPIVDEFKFRTPALIFCTGSSYSGKTEWILKVIEKHEELFTPNVSRIVFVYAEKQPDVFERLKKAYPAIELIEGLYKLQSGADFSADRPTLLILDDVGHEAGSSEYILQLAVRESHHKNITVIYVQHNLYQQLKFSKTISLQSKYICLFKNLRDSNQYKYLGNQVFGTGRGTVVVQTFKDASESANYPHLIIDIHPESDSRVCLISNLFPNSEELPFPVVYEIKE